MKNEIQVSVLCTVFNHEKYIRKCLEGFVNQKTNFKYEVLINDDASTDNSAKIIKEYEKKYPEIIKPIYQKENQYSKKVPIINTILFPKSHGKYIAFCEGDDYWIDNNKLQKQFDIMEQHPDCSMCVHNTIRHDLLGYEKDVPFCDFKEERFLNEEDVFLGWKIHTSSYFIREKDFLAPKYSWKYWFGDYVRLIHAYSKGKIIYIPDIMSTYNYNNKDGVTFKNALLEEKRGIEKIIQRKLFLLEFDEETNKKFHKIVYKRILQIEFQVLINDINKELKYAEYKELKKSIFNNKYLKDFLLEKSIIEKIRFNLLYRSFFIYKLRNFRRKFNEK